MPSGPSCKRCGSNVELRFVVVHKSGYYPCGAWWLCKPCLHELERFLDGCPIPGGFPKVKPNRPTIVCLCGSTRFMEAFFEEGWKLTLEGKIVLSVGVCKHSEDHGGEALGPIVAKALDELHLRKIDLADEVRILNVGGYIGKSTQSELDYSRMTGKPVTFLEGDENGEGGEATAAQVEGGQGAPTPSGEDSGGDDGSGRNLDAGA